MTPTPLPYPNLPSSPADFERSADGRELHDSFMEKPPGAAPKDELKDAPDWHKVKGATGPAVAKTSHEDGQVMKGGHLYVIKDGYGYKAD